MQIENLSWFPGHMTKTKRMIASELPHMDAVCEILDARIPLSSRNPDVDELTAGKPRLIGGQRLFLGASKKRKHDAKGQRGCALHRKRRKIS